MRRRASGSPHLDGGVSVERRLMPVERGWRGLDPRRGALRRRRTISSASRQAAGFEEPDRTSSVGRRARDAATPRPSMHAEVDADGAGRHQPTDRRESMAIPATEARGAPSVLSMTADDEQPDDRRHADRAMLASRRLPLIAAPRQPRPDRRTLIQDAPPVPQHEGHLVPGRRTGRSRTARRPPAVLTDANYAPGCGSTIAERASTSSSKASSARSPTGPWPGAIAVRDIWRRRGWRSATTSWRA